MVPDSMVPYVGAGPYAQKINAGLAGGDSEKKAESEPAAEEAQEEVKEEAKEEPKAEDEKKED